MADFQQLLDQAAAFTAPTGVDGSPVLNNPITDKKNEVAALAAEKKQTLPQSPTAAIPDFYSIAAGMGNQKGANSMGEIESDLRTLTPYEVYLKHGQAGLDLLNQTAAAGTDYYKDILLSDSRSGLEPVVDTVSGIAGGAVGGLASLGALGIGAIDAESGASAAAAVQDGMKWLEGTQSEGLAAARRVSRTKAALAMRDNAAEMERDIANGDSELLAGISRWGKDVVDTIANAAEDDTAFIQGSAEAGGSLLAGGPLAKGLKVIGGTALKTLGRMGVPATGNVMTKLAAAGNKAAWPLATAGLEGGGTYTGTADEVLNMNFDDLSKNSPDYNALISQGMTPEEARFEIANDAGMRAAAVQGTVAAITAGLTRYAETPFKVPSTGAAVRNVGSEGLEEAFQGTSGGLAQNEAIQRYANTTKDLSEGVGEQTALGALYGAGSAGIVQAPGAAARGTVQAGQGAFNIGKGVYHLADAGVAAGIDKAKKGHFYQSLLERGRLAVESLEKGSPISDQAMSEMAVQAATAAPETISELATQVEAVDATPEAKAAGVAYGQNLIDALSFDPVEFGEVPESQKPLLDGAEGRVDAIQKIAGLINRTDDPMEQIQAAATLTDLMAPIAALREDDPDILADVELSNNVKVLQTLVANIENSPAVSRALRKLNEVVAKQQENALIKPVTEASIDTVEGRQNIKNAVAVATLTPDKGNLEATEQILTHAASGKLNLTIEQLQALRGSRELLRARAKLEAGIAAGGLKKAKDVVSSQVVAGNDPLRKIAKSALQHTNEILSAMRGRNTDLGAARLEDFGKFVQHMQNKVSALNQHFQQGGGDAVPYMALQANEERDFKQSREGMYVNTRSPNSLDAAQSIALEASILSDVYNGLVSAFPDLGQTPINSISLDPALQGDVIELVRQFRDGQVVPKVGEKADVQQEDTATPEPAGTSENESKPVQAGTETESQEEGARSELKENPAGEVRKIRGGKVTLVESEEGPVSSIKAFIDGEEVGELLYTKDNSMDQSVEVSEGFQRRGIAAAMYDLARERGAELAPAKNQSEAGAKFNPVEATSAISTEEAPVGDKLYEGDKNMFNESFREPKEEKTFIHNDPTPRATVAKVLSSALRFKGWGAKTRNELTPEIIAAYKRLLDGPKAVVNVLLDNVNGNLQSFLKRPYSKSDSRTMAEIFAGDLEIKKQNGDVLSGGEMNRFQNGKVLNLVEQQEDGFDYNQSLLEKAGLATIQWVLSSANYESNMDANDVADLVGVPYISDTLVTDLSEGLSTEQAVRSLGQKIAQYWGMDANRNTDDSYVEGIPQSMAAEMLRGLEQVGLLEIKTIKVTAEQLAEMGAKDSTPKTFNRFLVKEVNEDSPLHQFQDAIEVVVMKEPKHTNYFNDEIPPVAERQMNNPEVANTADQKAAIEKEQQTPFYIVPMMKTFFDNMGVNNLLSLFGTPIEDPEDWNQNHLKSVEGKNRSISAAFQHMQNVAADLSNTAQALGKDITDVAIRYAYNMSRVGRMQMLGKYNPQASKLVREVFSPTRSTLDLSGANPDHWNAYSLGLAQAFGIKIHNLSLADTQEKLGEMLNGPFDDAIEMLNEWMKNPGEFSSNQVETLREGFGAAGADLSMVSLHALLDYVRFSNTDDQSNFTTSMYVEADGVTNGPINAMALMTIGRFSEEWANNIEKGGLSLGAAKSMAQIRERNAQDLYQASTDATRERLTELRDQLARQDEGAEQSLEMMDHLLSVMSLFNKDIIFNPDRAWDEGGLEMKRGIAKNPLTITIYGSGARGISNKLIGAITDGIYAQFTAAIQAQKADPGMSFAEAMFPDAIDPEINLKEFQASLDALTSVKAKRVKGQLTFERNGSGRQKFDPKTFTFNKVEMENLHENMLKLFVEPMRQGIEDTVGERLFKAVGLVRDATQVQSVIYQYEYMKQLEQLMDDRAENDPNWRQGDFVSRADREKIAKGLTKIAPLIKTGDQTFLVSSNEKMEIAGTDVVVGSALDGTMRTGPTAYAPGPAGVRGIPMLTIGMGDGMMMQFLAKLGLEGTLKIFDGMNMPLDKIKEQSLLANEAVWESWKGNPLREVAKTFDTFLKNYNPASINETTRDALVLTLFDAEERFDDNFTVTDELIKERLQMLSDNLNWSARSIDARHQALETVPVSVDQMASVATPFTNGVEVSDSDNQRTLLIKLNDKYEELMKASESAPIEEVQPEAAPEVEAAVAEPARISKTGARVLTWENIPKVFKKATDAQKEIWGEMRRSLAAKEYKVVFGSIEQLDKYIDENGLQARPQQEAFGWTNIADKTIYMINPTSETLIHELVHASSYETILDHYNGTSENEVKVAVQHLEDLMEDFLSMDTTEMTPEMLSSYESARSAILSANLESDSAVAQAKALNEFMAWGLSNQELTKALKERKAPKVVQLVKSVVNLIKKLIWGRRKAPAYADDFLANLQFNSGMIFRSQPSIAKIARQGELFHSNAYGTSERLKAVRQSFGKKIIDYLAADKIQKGVKMRSTVSSDAQLAAVEVAIGMQAHGFPMTPQESVTFQMIVAALATEAEIDPNALARAQELYAHVIKTIKVEDFMEDPESLDPSARYYAQEKYNSVVGSNVQLKDAKDRSSLLPAFLGLSVVSDEFRNVLKKMQLPKTEKNKERTLDALLENFGNTVMDSLSHRLSGDNNSSNAMQSIDNLMRRIQDTVYEEQSLLDKFASRSGGLLDSLNTYVKEGMEKLSDLGMETASDLDKKAKNTMTQLGARMLETLSAVVSEKNGLRVAEQTMVMLNKSGVWEPFHKLMSDLIGRTSSNALIYDMIKITRSMVQQVRQQFREETPRIIMSKFKGKMSSEQWTTMFNAMGRTDLAVLRDTMSHEDIQALFSDQTKVDTEINKLEALIQGADARHWDLLQAKMKQLAAFMGTGVPGANLLRNAESIAALHGESVNKGRKLLSATTVKQIDKLITLYAIENLTDQQKTDMASLVQNESEGLSFTLDYLDGQRKEEMAKATGKAKINAYKGFIPSENQPGVNLIVADDKDFKSLRERGFTRVAEYIGSSTERNQSKHGYYYAPISARAIFNQGIMQNVRHTAGGVDAVTGYTVHNLAGRITDKYTVRRLAARMGSETNMHEALLPVYNEYGQVIAMERSINPIQRERTKPSTHLPKMIGVWRGRQMEEGLSQIYNEKLIDNLKVMYDNDMKESSSNQNQYVNLLASKQINAVQQDAVNLFTDQTMDYIRAKFGEEFWVRKDLLDDAVGYRSASVGDFWTGNTTWSPETQDTFKHLMAGVFGANAYRYLVGAEKVIQNFMADARTLIVVKSIVVPVSNFASNMYQLISRGVPVLNIARNVPKKLAEIDNYTKSNLRLIDAEAELRAATGDIVVTRKLKAEIQSIEDAHRRLSIWPLIQAGEFSTIADVGMTSEDLEIGKGRFVERIERWVDQLPESVRNAGRYAIITRDTALFQGLQKSVQYGDFIAKAVLYDDLVKRQGMLEKDALARITEEFVNYDRLPGRFRSYLENMGLLWFYNFKIRISKVAVSSIRNNPVHALIAMGLPAPDGVGLPFQDSLWNKLADGSFHWSVGPEMGLKAPFLNPWLNVVN